MTTNGKMSQYKVALLRSVINFVAAEENPDELISKFMAIPESEVIPDPQWVLEKLAELSAEEPQPSSAG